MSRQLKNCRVWQPCWKLTTEAHTTHGGTAWGAGAESPHGAKAGDTALCDVGWYHAYANPYLAVLLNPIHANIQVPVLWLAEWRGKRLDDNGLKFGATELRTVQIVPAPIVTAEQQVAFSLLCAAQVFDERTCPAWHEWAAKWMTGEDRSESAARSAAWSAESAARSAAWSAESAARSAAWSAESAARSAESAARSAAWSAESAARSAAWSAESAAWSAADVLETAVAWALAIEGSDLPESSRSLAGGTER